MEDINKIMKNINVPYLNNYMSKESIILGFIQFVKDIERTPTVFNDRVIDG